MKTIVYVPQPRFQHVRVDLGGRQIGVAEHQLNRAQVGAALEEVRRKGMADDVRTERPRQLRLPSVLLQDLPEADARQWPAARVDEEPRRAATLQQFPTRRG